MYTLELELKLPFNKIAVQACDLTGSPEDAIVVSSHLWMFRAASSMVAQNRLMLLIVLEASSYLSFRFATDCGTETQRSASWNATPATLNAETGSMWAEDCEFDGKMMKMELDPECAA
jgi:hypothetical protein